MQQKLGSMIGAIGGLVFILANASMLPAGLAGPVRVLGVLGFAVVLWWAVLRKGRIQASPPAPGPAAVRTYGFAVLGMAVAIPLGATVLRKLDQPGLILPWVVLAVGAHFYPFARAFAVPLFARLSVVLVAVAVLGGVAVLLGLPAAAGWTAVVAGFVLLGFSAAGALRAPATSDPSFT